MAEDLKKLALPDLVGHCVVQQPRDACTADGCSQRRHRIVKEELALGLECPCAVAFRELPGERAPCPGNDQVDAAVSKQIIRPGGPAISIHVAW